jgi:hypothetical protein
MANNNAAVRYVHEYHAEAHSLSGEVQLPLTALVKRQAFVRLRDENPDYLSQHAKNFRLEGVFSYAAAHTQVSGNESKKVGGGFVTLATSVVEDLNVLNVVTADRVVAQISTKHPVDGGVPSVTFLGTHFEGLKIARHKWEPSFDLNLCGKPGATPYNDAKGGFVASVGKQYDILRQRLKDDLKDVSDERREEEGLEDLPRMFEEEYALAKLKNLDKESKVKCSLVQKVERTGPKVEDVKPTRSFGHVIHVPDFGTIFLAELTVDHNSFNLTMIRLDLGCIAHGTAKIVNCEVNGKGGGG